MCTVSWLHEDGGYAVFFNRDERRARSPALAPRVHESRGVRFVSATDGDGGGTWLAVNEFGLTVGLLNGYHRRNPPEPTDGYTSRGLLVRVLADSRTATELRSRLEAAALTPYRAFVLPVWTPAGPGPVFHWSATGLVVQDRAPESLPLISSSYEPARVIRSRSELFTATVIHGSDGSALSRRLDYHRSHHPERGPLSPCMHRPDAHTVSFSRIRVDAEQVVYDYAPAALCTAEPRASVALPRQRPTQ